MRGLDWGVDPSPSTRPWSLKERGPLVALEAQRQVWLENRFFRTWHGPWHGSSCLSLGPWGDRAPAVPGVALTLGPLPCACGQVQPLPSFPSSGSGTCPSRVGLLGAGDLNVTMGLSARIGDIQFQLNFRETLQMDPRARPVWPACPWPSGSAPGHRRLWTWWGPLRGNMSLAVTGLWP